MKLFSLSFVYLLGNYFLMMKVAAFQVNKTVSFFDNQYLDPDLMSNEEFVSALEQHCLNHEALSHHFLESLAGATFGKEETAKKLLELFSAYQVVNTNFKDNVRLLMEQLDKEEHVEILEENQKEENGEYDDELLNLLESRYNVSTAAVNGIPHSVLYTRMVESMECSLNRSVRPNVPSEVVYPMREAIMDLRGDIQGLLALLYFGSEFIVPKLYSALLRGMSSSMDLSNDQMAFLILHTDVDQEHAEEMRKILLHHCISHDDRRALVLYAEHFLQARVNFFDSLNKHSPFQTTDVSTDNLSMQPVCSAIQVPIASK